MGLSTGSLGRVWLSGLGLAPVVLVAASAAPPAGGAEARSKWRIGTPIVTYWAGPPLTDYVARQMAVGGWNLVWCEEKQLPIAQRHGLRAQLVDSLLSPQSLDDAAKRAQLDALIERVRNHPALYCYFITDEPNAAAFPALGRLVVYLRERDPAHMAYINLFPTYASNEQLGTKGDVVTAYREHLRQYLEIVKPDLISYDHYHFLAGGNDGDQYFLNLAMIRQAALDAGLPFMNIVQATQFAPSMRVPTGDELRWLNYTSLAYGAQAISYFTYGYSGIADGLGQFANSDGTPTALYHAVRPINHEFVAVAEQLQPLRSLGAYHAGMVPKGAEALPPKAPFRFDPPVPEEEYRPPAPVKGMLIGVFGRPGVRGRPGRPTHAVVVNLDYRNAVSTTVVGPAALDVFDATTRVWQRAGGSRVELQLPPGGGRLLRVRGRGVR